MATRCFLGRTVSRSPFFQNVLLASLIIAAIEVAIVVILAAVFHPRNLVGLMVAISIFFVAGLAIFIMVYVLHAVVAAMNRHVGLRRSQMAELVMGVFVTAIVCFISLVSVINILSVTIADSGGWPVSLPMRGLVFYYWWAARKPSETALGD